MQLSKYIDHTLLKATATQNQIEQLCHEAIEYSFASVCIPSRWVELSARLLNTSQSKVCTVVGFPLGHSTTETKLAETQLAIKQGASEIDMVICIADSLEHRWSRIEDETRQICRTCHRQEVQLKVIFETCYLESHHIKRLSIICEQIGVDFIKTSTGFGTGGATIEAVKIMKQNFSRGIKASGGIKNKEQAMTYINLGCTRLGTSSGIAIAKS